MMDDTLNIGKFPSGTIIISDESPKEMIVVLQGDAGLYKNYKKPDEIFIKSVGAGNFCCEQSLFLNREHDNTLVAVSDVFALAITRDNINEFYAKFPDVAFSITEAIYQKFVDATALLWDIKAEVEEQTEAEAKGNYKPAPKPAQKYTLFPEGHGDYTLALSNANANIISLTQSACPLCGRKFDSHYILMSKLRRDKTDPDMRIRYKDAEPLHYNVITCPNCLFSAESTSFPTAQKKHTDAVNDMLAKHRAEISIKTGAERDSLTVFAGYYLALLCAPIVFDNHELVVAGLWLKISRLYEDCGDSPMHIYAVKQALEAYNHVYTNICINDKQTQQVRFVIAELYFKLGAYDESRQFFYMLKADPLTPLSISRPVEARLDKIKEIKNPG
jgi:hypothetical protein